MSQKPTLALIHGAFHGPDSFHLIKPKLEALGYQVVPVALATSGVDHPTATYRDDVAAVHEAIKPALDEGKEVILVAQSVFLFLFFILFLGVVQSMADVPIADKDQLLGRCPSSSQYRGLHDPRTCRAWRERRHKIHPADSLFHRQRKRNQSCGIERC